MDSDQQATLLQPTAVPHPGEVVADYLEFHGWAQRDLARRTGLTPKTISEICNGKAPVTAPTALALEKALQRPAHFWLNLQRQLMKLKRETTHSRKAAHGQTGPASSRPQNGTL